MRTSSPSWTKEKKTPTHIEIKVRVMHYFVCNILQEEGA